MSEDHHSAERAHVMELVERSAREMPRCEHCGAPSAPFVRGDALWFECSTLRESKSRLRRLLTTDGAGLHTRVLLTELASTETAA